MEQARLGIAGDIVALAELMGGEDPLPQGAAVDIRMLDGDGTGGIGGIRLLDLVLHLQGGVVHAHGVGIPVTGLHITGRAALQGDIVREGDAAALEEHHRERLVLTVGGGEDDTDGGRGMGTAELRLVVFKAHHLVVVTEDIAGVDVQVQRIMLVTGDEDGTDGGRDGGADGAEETPYVTDHTHESSF